MEITINELIEKDKTFSESEFKSKVENQFMQIFLAVTVGKIERIDHFVNDEVYARLKAIVEDNAAKNVIHFYEEPNVSNINISRIIEEEDSFTIEANVLFKAYDYFASKGDLKFISGNKDYRTETVHRIFFKKMKSAREFGIQRKCPTCGNTLDTNYSGLCPYCKTVFDLETYDWVITFLDI
jgi:predicted lipid-binding transport protein (Tim44 family)